MGAVRSWPSYVLACALFGALAFLPTAHGFSIPEFQDLYGSLNESPRSQKALIKSLKDQDPSRFQYVLIPGFLNEALHANFSDWLVVFQELKLKPSNVTFLRLASKASVRANARELQAQLERIANDSGRPLVLFSHSKGAVESLVAAVQNPEFWLENVQFSFMIQGAFGGSPLADYVEGEGISPDERMSVGDRLVLEGANQLGDFLSLLMDKGIRALTSKKSQKLVKGLIKTGVVQDLRDRLYFVVSSQTKKDYSPLVVSTGSYINTYYSKSDGLVCLTDQAVPELGRVLLNTDADHMDLVMAAPVSNGPVSQRRALILSLLQSVF